MEVLEQMIAMEREKAAFGSEQDQGAQQLKDFDSAITAKERTLTSLKSRLQAYHQLRHRCGGPVGAGCGRGRGRGWGCFMRGGGEGGTCPNMAPTLAPHSHTQLHVQTRLRTPAPPPPFRYDMLLEQVQTIEDEKAELLARSQAAKTSQQSAAAAKKRLHVLEQELKRLRSQRAQQRNMMQMAGREVRMTAIFTPSLRRGLGCSMCAAGWAITVGG